MTRDPKIIDPPPCTCETPNPSGPLNGGVEICLNCGWEVMPNATP